VRIKATEQYYWLSWLCSYFVAFIFLFSSYPARPALAVDPVLGEKQVTYKMILRQMVSFGLPITVWQVISFLMLNADRWYLVKFKFDSALTSDYLALSDVMMRGSGFMFSPLVSAAYPMISRIFDKGDFREVKRLILQILKWEVVILCVALLGFFILHSILFSTLNFKTRDYSIFMIGVVLLIVHSLWQMSAMLHKVAELNLISSLMVRGILLSCLISYTALYFIIIPKTTIQVLFCFSLGILSYFIYAIVLFRKYLPSYVQK
jgi:O-antigen/teichoic acid export membrane protein